MSQNAKITEIKFGGGDSKLRKVFKKENGLGDNVYILSLCTFYSLYYNRSFNAMLSHCIARNSTVLNYELLCMICNLSLLKKYPNHEYYLWC